LVSRHRDVPQLKYDTHFSLCCLEYQRFYISISITTAQRRGLAAFITEHRSAAEYAVGTRKNNARNETEWYVTTDGLSANLYCLRFGTAPTWRARSRVYIPQEEGDPVLTQTLGYCPNSSQIQSYITTDGSVGQSVLKWSTHLGLTKRSLLLSDSCRLVDVGRSLWREDGSVVCQTQSAVIRFLSVCTIYMLQVIKCMYVQNMQGLCQSRLSRADLALSLVALATTAA
jgi:hypothetical protein